MKINQIPQVLQLRKISFLILAFCSLAQPVVEHAPTDPRSFYHEVLDNGLTILLVQDPKARESAATMQVMVGSEDDPQGIEGLAHFLEHMLFIGTEAYPEVDELQHYVQEHGGMSNAFTARDHTRYFFSVKPEYFSEGLDIFTSFFVSPLFSPEYIERERHAVHAEFKMHQDEDGWRRHQVSALTGNLEHGANRFHVGNLDTLSGELREVLVDFYQTHYSADRMYFVAVVPDDIKNYLPDIKQSLSKVPVHAVVHDTQPHILTQEQMGRMIHHKTLKDDQGISVEFLLPSQREHYLSPAADYISKLIGDEGPGSVLAELKQRGWALSLSAGCHDVSDQDALFSVHVGLTKEGFEHVDEVMSAIMSYIDLVRDDGVSLWRFAQAQRVGYLHYLFYRQQSVLSQIGQFAARLPDYPVRLLQKVGYVTDESIFDPSHIRAILDRLTLKNARVWQSSPNEAVDQIDDIYGVQYANHLLTDAQIKSWSRPSELSLALPKPNEYIPSSVALMPQDLDVKVPTQLSPGAWYMPDNTFKQPRQYWQTLVSWPHNEELATNISMMFIPNLLRQAVNTQLYAASEAGLDWSINTFVDGIELSVTGMGDQHGRVMSMLEQGLADFSQIVPSTLFDIVKQQMLENIDNMDYEKPASLLRNRLASLLSVYGYALPEVRETIERQSYEGLIEFVKKGVEQSSVQRFYYGNIDKDEVVRTSKDLKPYEAQKDVMRLRSVQVGDQMLGFATKQKDYGLLMYYQMPDKQYKDIAMTKILADMISAPFFAQLRTNEQIGYIVSAGAYIRHRWPGLVLNLQSPHMKPLDIQSRVLSFLTQESFWDEAAFETVKKSLIMSYEDPFETMGEVFNFYSYEILTQRYDYNYRQSMVKALKGISLSDVRSYFQANVLDVSRRLTLVANDDATHAGFADFVEGAPIVSGRLSVE